MTIAPDKTYDAVVIGGGPAGLQAALTLGRMRRDVVAFDSSEYRNASARHMHNAVTRDGTSPEDFRTAARAELAAYDTVETCEAKVTEVVPEGDVFSVRVDAAPDGGSLRVRAKNVILATGLRDTLPDTPGLAELWGDIVAQCPYCHGYELKGRHVAILGSGPHAGRVSMLLARIADRITVLADGEDLEGETRELLARNGVHVREEPISGVQRRGDGAVVSFADGPAEEIGGMFVTTGSFAQAAPFAEQLGLAMLPSGCIRTDELGRTSRDGIYAAGDLAHLASLPMPLASVVTAISAGLLAATAVDQDLVDAAIADPVPAMA